ncbi:MAG TPA: L-seryl-tRNA(Sec) selenium transferase [Gemmatimonadaceae bacterium]|nr:L-seryl-tRNA(Sec) selenium transferase [Gemmatimonadaceae bacterium]
MVSDPRRALPSVNALLEKSAMRDVVARAPRPLVTSAVRAALDAARRDPSRAPRTDAEWAAAVDAALAERERASLRPLINATGVVLHTNFGRAPLATAALTAIDEIARGYTNLEYDLDAGERGSRSVHCVALLRELTGAGDALVVNNCAAAIVLVLNTLASGREAIVSRGELVEIGGSFRIPDIMAKSDARLVEVGTTNRTHLADYRAAIGAATGAVVKVHRSNFALEGYVAEAGVRELAPLCAEHGIPLVHDLGSGLMMRLDAFGLSGEPVAAEALTDGATVVTMSGDKLLGGPQAGIILGRSAVVARMRANPLARALRVDKLTLAALEATLALYREPERARREIPTLALLTAPVSGLRERVERLAGELTRAGVSTDVVASEGSVGGGAFPTARLPSVALALEGEATHLDARLRAGSPPVVGRIVDGRLLLDWRALLPDEDETLLATLRRELAPERRARR